MDIIRTILASADLNEAFSFARFFWLRNHYSIFNGLLIFAQKPGAVMLATEGTWESMYGRYLKPEATPIVILKPFGPVEFIYDYIDTYGDSELYPKRPTLSKNTWIEDWWIDELKESLVKNGIYYSEKSFGTLQGAEICIVYEPITYIRKTGNGKEKRITTDCCITVNSSSDNASKFESVLHELGHLYCGHLPRGKYTPKDITFPNRKIENLTRNQKEFEAELTKQTVCQILGFNVNVEHYLQGYLNEDGKTPDVDWSIIIKAADKILNMLPERVKYYIESQCRQLSLFERFDY